MQSLHPLMPILRPYSPKRMRALVGAALTICNVLYLIIAIGCCLAFGPDLHSDVLENINPGAMAPLVGQAAALAIAYSLRFGYLLSLVGSYVLVSWMCTGGSVIDRAHAIDVMCAIDVASCKLPSHECRTCNMIHTLPP